MTLDSDDERSRAEGLMRQHRFDEAIALLRAHLEQHPEEPHALLELGICHLLNCSEAEFMAIHGRAARLIATLARPAPELSRLWSLYRSLAAKLTTTALVVGTAAAAGCDRNGPPAEVLPEPTTTAAEPAGETPAPTASPGTGGSGAGETPSAAASPATEPSATATAAPSPAPTEVRPAHRYSGGVVSPPVAPAHRYSGGVRRQ